MRFPKLPFRKRGHARRPELEQIYADRAGRRYYAWRDPLETPAQRLVALESAARFLELNLTRERLAEALEHMEQCANNGKIVDLYRMIAELKARLELAADEECLLQLAACYFLRDDEPPEGYDARFQEKKIAAWREDPEALDFFLTACLRRAAPSATDSTSDFLASLKRLRPLAERLNRLSSPK